jgi:hypothetical protein
MAKYIHKQAAIHALVNEANNHNNPIKRAYTRAAVIIEQITAEDVQPVRCGEWEKKSSVGVFRCSLCQHIFMLGADEIDEYHFCPNCGADMRGDENG